VRATIRFMRDPYLIKKYNYGIVIVFESSTEMSTK